MKTQDCKTQDTREEEEKMMKKQLNKIRKMAGMEIGRRSAGRADTANSGKKELRRKEDYPLEWRGFSLREMDEACRCGASGRIDSV